MNVFDPFYHKNTNLIWCRGEYNCIYVIKRDDLMKNYSVNNDILGIWSNQAFLSFILI